MIGRVEVRLRRDALRDLVREAVRRAASRRAVEALAAGKPPTPDQKLTGEPPVDGLSRDV